MEANLELGQIFWLIIPLFKKKLRPRPFLVYEINNTTIAFLSITSNDKSECAIYTPQCPLVRKPNGLYKKSFVDLNILTYIEYDLFLELLRKVRKTIKQGEKISKEDFYEIREELGI